MIRYHARWVLPIAGPPLKDGTLVEDGGRIVYCGTRDSAPPGRDHDLGNVLLLPGLVNVHAHLDLSVMRGYLEELPFAPWIRRLTRAKRQLLTQDDLLDAARLSLLEALLHGITAVGDTSDTMVAPTAMRELGVRGTAYLEVFGPEPSHSAAALEELRERVAAAAAAAGPLVRIGVSPHAPYSVSDELFTATAAFARHAGLPMAVHVAESEAETQLVRDGSGPFADALRDRGIAVAPRAESPIALLERTGVLQCSPLLIHVIRAGADDLTRLREHGCAIAHCPAANAKLGHGIAPLVEMLDAGITVGLGSDSVAANNRMDLLEEARMAVLMQRVRLGSPDCLSAARALEIATLGGARALGLEREIGTLEPGKSADVAAFPLGASTGTPVTDPSAAAVFALGGVEADFVMIRGVPLVQNGRVSHEPIGVRERVQIAASRLSEDARAAAPR